MATVFFGISEHFFEKFKSLGFVSVTRSCFCKQSRNVPGCGARPPVAAENRPCVNHRAFFGDVCAALGAVIKEQFTGGKIVVLPSKETVFSLVAFDRCGDFSAVRTQPCDDARGVRHIRPVERNGLGFDDGHRVGLLAELKRHIP